MQSHTVAKFWEGMVWSLCRATANLVWYLGLQALVSEIINRFKLVYGTIASIDILLQNFYKVQQGRAEKVMLYETHLEGALNAVQQEYLMMLSASEVKQHLRNWLLHRIHKQLQDSMCYLHDDTRITYFALI